MTPIERAARAVADTVSALPSSENNLAIARAVIAAIREPSEGMIGCGGEAIEKSPIDTDDIEMARLAWPAMIDALVEEGE